MDEFLENDTRFYNNVNHDNPNEEPKDICLGITFEEFGKMYDETNGFEEVLPKDDLPKVADNSFDWLVQSSKEHTKRLLRQRKEEN